MKLGKILPRLYIYIYIYIYIYMYIYLYLYIYIYTKREKKRQNDICLFVKQERFPETGFTIFP